MTAISLKIEDSLLSDTQKIVVQIKQSRNSYINEAIRHYNQLQLRNRLAAQLAIESKLVQTSSAEVLSEMEQLENDYEY